ncbi:MAG TPA: VIT1/CCC1 transporter family protein [Aggregatilineaceae bacterium]|nr:VIT1/CCC1 transporter family protein [Aggregatilineaceae bacterium]
MIKSVQSMPVFQRIWQSFMSALGSIVFGMEDGTVSIFGLVFGVAASASSSQIVLLAGATGAVSAAVSMMAGTYLDVSTERDRAQAAIANEQREIGQKPEEEAQEVRDRLVQAGLSQKDAETVLTIIQRTPGAMLKGEIAFEFGKSADQNPWVQSIWMFIADLFAAFVPVVPFAFLPLGSARTLSLIVTMLLLLLLGVGRGIIGHKNVVVTALQTLAIAAAAGAAGLLVGSLIGGQISG